MTPDPLISAIATALMMTDPVPMTEGWPGYRAWSERIASHPAFLAALADRDAALVGRLEATMNRQIRRFPLSTIELREAKDAVLAAIRDTEGGA